MGKTVLLLLTAVVIGGTMLSLGQAGIMASTDESHRENASEAYSRELADAATQAVLATALRDRRFSPDVQTGRLASYGGGDFELTRYAVSGPNDNRVDFTVRGRFPYRLDADGSPVYTEQEITSAYEWVPPGFPCALSLGSYVNTLDLDGSTIGGVGMDGEPRPSCFDRRQYDSYRLGDFPGLEWENHEATLADSDAGMAQSNPTAGMAIPGPGQEHATMSDMYADHNAPTPDVFSTNAPAYLSEGDARFSTPHTIGSGETLAVGDPALGEDPRIAYFDSSLTIEQTGRLEGAGLLVVNGNLILKDDAEIDWSGMVIVRSTADTLVVDLDRGSVHVNGTFVVDHDAPPPGGHMDLTVWRDYNTYFPPAQPWGEAVLAWQNGPAPNKKVYAHTHRYGDKGAGRTPLSGTSWQGQSSSTTYPAASRPQGGENGARRIVFRDPDISPLHTISGNPGSSGIGMGTSQPGIHERETRFHEALGALGNQQVYVQFVDEDGDVLTPGGKGRPDRYNGASRVTLTLPGSTPCLGTPGDLGNACRRSGSLPNASRSFQANQLDGLVVEIGSLRLLRRITDHEPLSPDGDFYEDGDGNLHGNLLAAAACPAVTDGTSYFRDRDGFCTSNDNPVTMSYFPERKGALRLQLRRHPSGDLVYEAAMYWHRKSPGSSEYEQEVEADEDFFEAVVNGEAYGVSFDAGDALTIDFTETTLLPLYERFGRNNPQLAHLSSQIQRVGGYAQGTPAPAD